MKLGAAKQTKATQNWDTYHSGIWRMLDSSWSSAAVIWATLQGSRVYATSSPVWWAFATVILHIQHRVPRWWFWPLAWSATAGSLMFITIRRRNYDKATPCQLSDVIHHLKENAEVSSTIQEFLKTLTEKKVEIFHSVLRRLVSSLHPVSLFQTTDGNPST